MRRIISPAVICIFAVLSLLRAQDFGGKPFVAGCAQIFVTDDVQKNLEKYLSFIHKADSQSVDILIFPETSLSGYGPIHYKDKPMPPREVLEDILRKVCDTARETGIWVIVGTSTYREDGIYNDIHLIDNKGEIRATYAKAQLTGGDATFYQPGKEIATYQAGGMKFGLEICYDIRFPEPWRLQALDGAQIIFHASQACGNSSWKIPVWEGHLRSRAAENGIWVVSCNAAGPIQMGKSYIIDPDGLVVAQSNQDSEELITGVVDLSRENRVNIDRRRTDLYRLVPAEKAAP